MVDREVFDRRLAQLEELLRRLRRLGSRPREEYLGSDELHAQAERWLQLTAECALDLAHHLIADRGWRTPASYRDAFRVLVEEGVLTPEFAGRMELWAGLRNVLVHLYLDVDHNRLWEIIQHNLDDLVELAQALVRAAG